MTSRYIRKELSDLCVWKEVANTDDKKREQGNKHITLSRDKLCYLCDGYEHTCDSYIANDKGGK